MKISTYSSNYNLETNERPVSNFYVKLAANYLKKGNYKQSSSNPGTRRVVTKGFKLNPTKTE